MCFGRVEESPFLPQLKKDVRVQEEDGSVVQYRTVGCEPGGGWDQWGRVFLTYILIVVGGIEAKKVKYIKIYAFGTNRPRDSNPSKQILP